MSNALSLPASKTGPASVEATRERAFARHAVPADLRETIAVARKSGLLPSYIKTDEQAIVAALKGRELGLPPLQAFSAIHVIQGVPTLSASLMLGIAFRRLPGFDYQIVERGAKRCCLRGRRSPQHSTVEVSYTWEEAERAGLTSKDNWRKNPAAMLFARATGVLCRAIAPDTFTGLYAPEEIEVGGPADAEPLEPVQPVEVPAEATVAPEAPAAQTFNRNALIAGLREESIRGDVKRAAEKLGLAGKAPKDMSDADLQRLHDEVFNPISADPNPDDLPLGS